MNIESYTIHLMDADGDYLDSFSFLKWRGLTADAKSKIYPINGLVPF